MEFIPLTCQGSFEIRPQIREDARGYFMRAYDREFFAARGLATEWVQENQSLSVQRGTIRGLHFQVPPCAETKLVRVVSGALLDVFVDLRKGSPTYGRHEAVELSAENRRMVYIPKGFAHGFCTLTDNVVVQYKVDHPYAPAHEGGLLWNDPTLAIPWPVREPILSARDQGLGPFAGWVSPF
jgi:dTDP-4-dehydrorhamnose 3,5-epimerase